MNKDGRLSLPASVRPYDLCDHATARSFDGTDFYFIFRLTLGGGENKNPIEFTLP